MVTHSRSDSKDLLQDFSDNDPANLNKSVKLYKDHDVVEQKLKSIRDSETKEIHKMQNVKQFLKQIFL